MKLENPSDWFSNKVVVPVQRFVSTIENFGKFPRFVIAIFPTPWNVVSIPIAPTPCEKSMAWILWGTSEIICQHSPPLMVLKTIPLSVRLWTSPPIYASFLLTNSISAKLTRPSSKYKPPLSSQVIPPSIVL